MQNHPFDIDIGDHCYLHSIDSFYDADHQAYTFLIKPLFLKEQLGLEISAPYKIKFYTKLNTFISPGSPELFPLYFEQIENEILRIRFLWEH